jgi:hypothetical protein
MRVFLSILLVILFAGCEKYESPTYPQLSGRWVIDGVSFPNLGNNSQILLSDTIILSQRVLTHIDSNGVGVFTQNWEDESIPWFDKFVIGTTVWEFETDLVGIPTTLNSGTSGYSDWSYYSLSPDLYDRDYWSHLTIHSSKARNINITQYGLETMTLTFPKIWTMYRYNGQTYFLEESVRLVLKRQ